jgi:hypothetical protein
LDLLLLLLLLLQTLHSLSFGLVPSIFYSCKVFTTVSLDLLSSLELLLLLSSLAKFSQPSPSDRLLISSLAKFSQLSPWDLLHYKNISFAVLFVHSLLRSSSSSSPLATVFPETLLTLDLLLLLHQEKISYNLFPSDTTYSNGGSSSSTPASSFLQQQQHYYVPCFIIIGQSGGLPNHWGCSFFCFWIVFFELLNGFIQLQL